MSEHNLAAKMPDENSKINLKEYKKVGVIGGIDVDAHRIGKIGSQKSCFLLVEISDVNGITNKSTVNLAEIDDLIEGIKELSKVNSSISKIVNFEAEYATSGGLNSLYSIN